MPASVASTSCVSFSYAASSQSSAKISPLSSGRARWIDSDIDRSHRDFGLDVRMRIVALEREVFVPEGEDVLHVGIDLHDGQRAGRPRELQPRLFEMVGIE